MHHGPVDECPDDERDWFPQRRRCSPAAQLAAARRLYELLHADTPYHDGTEKIWAENPSDITPFHFMDGVTIYLSETNEHPEDDFLGQRTADGLAGASPAGGDSESS